MNRLQIGYLMGLIVGEGSFTGDRKDPVLAIKLAEDDPQPLLDCQRFLGGKVYGPYRHAEKDGDKKSFIVWRLTGKPLVAALPMLGKHLPPSRKRNQFDVWLVKYGLSRYVKDQLQLVWHVEHLKKCKETRGVTEQLRLIQ